jgi:hypothetical protein
MYTLPQTQRNPEVHLKTQYLSRWVMQRVAMETADEIGFSLSHFMS